MRNSLVSAHDDGGTDRLRDGRREAACLDSFDAKLNYNDPNFEVVRQ